MKITSQTKAVIAVHLYEQVVDINLLLDLQKKYRIKLIEDAAQRYGGMLDRKVGALSDAAVFSFSLKSLHLQEAICINSNDTAN